MGKKVKAVQNFCHAGQIVQGGQYIEVSDEDYEILKERFVIPIEEEIAKLEAIMEEDLPVLQSKAPEKEEEPEEVEGDEELEIEIEKPQKTKKRARKPRKKRG